MCGGRNWGVCERGGCVRGEIGEGVGVCGEVR